MPQTQDEEINEQVNIPHENNVNTLIYSLIIAKCNKNNFQFPSNILLPIITSLNCHQY